MGKRYCAFDVGHGGKDSGATNGKRYEKDDVLKLACAVEDYIEKVTGNEVDCQKSRTTDKYLSLEERSQWQKRHPEYEFFVSFHRDSYKDKNSHGSHVCVYLNCNKKSKSYKLAECVAKRLNPIMKGRSEGITFNDYHVLRETSCPAILIECGFISNTNDNKIFDTKFNEIVKAIGDGIIEYANFKRVNNQTKPKPQKPSNKKVLYRVVTNTYENKENAINEQKKLKDKGIDSFIVEIGK